MRARAGGMLEGDEHVVVGGLGVAPAIDLGVDRDHGPEEHESLVDEVAAQVEEQPPA